MTCRVGGVFFLSWRLKLAKTIDQPMVRTQGPDGPAQPQNVLATSLRTSASSSVACRIGRPAGCSSARTSPISSRRSGHGDHTCSSSARGLALVGDSRRPSRSPARLGAAKSTGRLVRRRSAPARLRASHDVAGSRARIARARKRWAKLRRNRAKPETTRTGGRMCPLRLPPPSCQLDRRAPRGTPHCSDL